MKQAGQVVVFRFPQTDLEEGKLRPALLLGKLPGEYDDWLICMISSQTRQYIQGFDELVRESDADFGESGLKVTSVIRVGRLAVVSGEILLGAIGQVSNERLTQIKKRLSDWLFQTGEKP
jgi:mRNA interferase MazF